MSRGTAAAMHHSDTFNFLATTHGTVFIILSRAQYEVYEKRTAADNGHIRTVAFLC